jgi:uncharacterized RDD family membrane protein YckC
MTDPAESEPLPTEVPKPAIPRPYIPPPVIISPPPQPPHFDAESSKPQANPSTHQVDADDDGESEVGIEGSAVSFNTRITAAVIDLAVALGIGIGLSLILPAFADRLAWLCGMAYLVTRDSLPFLKGQSVGKKAMKIKVVTSAGESLVKNWSVALIRNGILLIPLFPLIELYLLLTREGMPEGGARLGDEWAKTKVIHAA